MKLVEKRVWEKEYQSGVWDGLHADHDYIRYRLLADYINRAAKPIHLCDVGCGPGVILDHVNPSVVVRYTGIDLSQTALDMVPRRHKDDRLICASIEDYSPDDAWDIVLFNEVLYYTKSPVNNVKKFEDALNPGGAFLISAYKKRGYFAYNNVCIRRLVKYFAERRYVMKDAIELTKLQSKASWQIYFVEPPTIPGVRFAQDSK